MFLIRLIYLKGFSKTENKKNNFDIIDKKNKENFEEASTKKYNQN